MTLEKFFKIIDALQPDENGCLIWPMCKDGKGYPNPLIDKKVVRGHRVSLARKLGRPIAEGMQALHTCDNPSCVNPEHLWEGTNQDNVDDRVKKGRSARLFGDKNPMKNEEVKNKLTGINNPNYGKFGSNLPGFGKNKGKNHYLFGKTGPLLGVKGNSHPSYGKSKMMVAYMNVIRNVPYWGA